MHLFPRKVQSRAFAAVHVQRHAHEGEGSQTQFHFVPSRVAVHAPETPLISSQFVSAIFQPIASATANASSIAICMHPWNRPTAKIGDEGNPVER